MNYSPTKQTDNKYLNLKNKLKMAGLIYWIGLIAGGTVFLL